MAIKQVNNLQQMLEYALSLVDELTVDQALALYQQPGFQFIDLRDTQELTDEGFISGAFNCPRGVLEFWADPNSEDAKPEFHSGDTLILFCAGGLRSALAAKTLLDMGFNNVKHIGGGFAAWKEQGGRTDV